MVLASCIAGNDLGVVRCRLGCDRRLYYC